MCECKYKAGLVLEGGGMRSVFTSGFLDCLMDYGVRFPYVIGTSAGASTGLSYVSGQRGRSRFSNIDLLKLYPYVGAAAALRGRGVIDLDYLFYTYPDRYYPFDFDAFCRSGVRFVSVASDAATGQAAYIEEYADFHRLVDVVRASCSLPIMCSMGKVDGRPMVDGGVCDSIPFLKALEHGCGKVLVVLTKEQGYRKSSGKVMLPPMVYSQYPKLRTALQRRNDSYNASLDALEALCQQGKAIVLRPEQSHGVGRCTSNIAKLENLYDEGYRVALNNINIIKEML